MTEVSGSIILARSLKSLGVDTVFFLTGSPMLEALRECSTIGIKVVDVRHEQAAAMMAHAYSRVTGKPGVCITASGPATVNAITGVGVAFDDCAPLIALGGSAAMASREKGSFEEMDQVGLMTPLTKKSLQVQATERISDFVGMAFRHAVSGRPGPVYLDFPGEVLYGHLDESRVKLPVLAERSRPRGDGKLVEKAMAMLHNAERPIVIAGSGVLWSEAGPELLEFVDRTQMPFFTTPLARGLIPEDHPLCFLAARSVAWKEADAIFVLGTRTNFIIQHLGAPRFARDAKIVMVNVDESEIGRNRDVDIGIVGDAKAVLKQFIDVAAARKFTPPALQKSWTQRLRAVNAEREEKSLPLLNSSEVPIHPLRLCKEIRDFLLRDAILAVDGHDILNFARQSIPTYHPRHRLNPGSSGCMGVGVPFGIGAKVARPDKQVLVLSGDGAFGFNGFEMDTAVRHKANVVVVISNNGSWGGVDPGKPRNTVGKFLGHTAYDRVVEALGGWGRRVEDPSGIRPALEEAFASGKPALINVIVSGAKAATQPFGSLSTADVI